MLALASACLSVSAKAGAEDDAAAMFFSLCGFKVANMAMPPDSGWQKLTQIDPQIFQRSRPGEPGPFFDAQSTRSPLRALGQFWANGNCTFEPVEADEAATRTAFEAALPGFVTLLGGTVERKVDKAETSRQGLTVTTSEWAITTSSQQLQIVLATMPRSAGMTQHMMLMRRAN